MLRGREAQVPAGLSTLAALQHPPPRRGLTPPLEGTVGISTDSYGQSGEVPVCV